MAKTMADVLREQGIEEGREEAKQEDIIKLLQIKFGTIPESITKKINSIQNLSRLNSLFEKAATIDTLDEIGLQNSDG